MTNLVQISANFLLTRLVAQHQLCFTHLNINHLADPPQWNSRLAHININLYDRIQTSLNKNIIQISLIPLVQTIFHLSSRSNEPPKHRHFNQTFHTQPKLKIPNLASCQFASHNDDTQKSLATLPVYLLVNPILRHFALRLFISPLVKQITRQNKHRLLWITYIDIKINSFYSYLTIFMQFLHFMDIFIQNLILLFN